MSEDQKRKVSATKRSIQHKSLKEFFSIMHKSSLQDLTESVRKTTLTSDLKAKASTSEDSIADQSSFPPRSTRHK